LSKTALVQEATRLACEFPFIPWPQGPLALVLAGGRVVRLCPRVLVLVGQKRTDWSRFSFLHPVRRESRLVRAPFEDRFDALLRNHRDTRWH
jgi:hypothetical protein